MKKICEDLFVHSTEQLSSRHWLISLRSTHPLLQINPGQFVQIKVEHSPETFLRRPISINMVDYQHNEITLLVAAVGAGTRTICQLQKGDTLNCLYPLGNGFTMPCCPEQRFLLIGGGVGTAPLLYFGKQIAEMGARPTFLLGTRTDREKKKKDKFEEYGDLYITTEDGSEGEQGFVTNHSILNQQKFDYICTCGPKPMMMSVARFAKANHIECEVSLENDMACGLGACLCCVEDTTEGNICVCKEGPVLNIRKLLWQL